MFSFISVLEKLAHHLFVCPPPLLSLPTPRILLRSIVPVLLCSVGVLILAITVLPVPVTHRRQGQEALFCQERPNVAEQSLTCNTAPGEEGQRAWAYDECRTYGPELREIQVFSVQNLRLIFFPTTFGGSGGISNSGCTLFFARFSSSSEFLPSVGPRDRIGARWL